MLNLFCHHYFFKSKFESLQRCHSILRNHMFNFLTIIFYQNICLHQHHWIFSRDFTYKRVTYQTLKIEISEKKKTIKNNVIIILKFWKREVECLMCRVKMSKVNSLIRFFIIDWIFIFIDINKSRKNNSANFIVFNGGELVKDFESSNANDSLTTQNEYKLVIFDIVIFWSYFFQFDDRFIDY